NPCSRALGLSDGAAFFPYGVAHTLRKPLPSVPDRRHTRHMSARVASLQRMAVPEIIPIVYEPDYHTGRIGHWEGGQFFGSAITAEERLKHWLDDLPGLRFGDIAIRPFQHRFDGVLFGLVIETFEGVEHAEFYPNNIGFYEPWDGSYDT